MLNLENFDENEKKAQEKKEDECKEHKEKIQFLQSQIKKIQKGYEQKLIEETEKIKEKTYKRLEEEFLSKLKEEKQKIQKSLQKEFEKEYNEKLQQELKRKEEEVKGQYKALFLDLEKKLKENIEKYENFIETTILETLEEIFDVLSFDKNNLDLVKKEIQNLLDEFKEYKPVKIKASPELAKLLDFKEIQIEINEDINNLEFEIEFENFKLQKDFQDIKQQVINEIKREIKTD